jgi:SSS family solute:Na+ symporter
MQVVRKYYSPAVLGFVAAAGTLAALIPASGQLLAAASIVGKNVFADYGFVRDEAAQTRTTRILVLVVAVLAFGFWAIKKTTLVGLLLIGYNGVTQFFPGVVLGVTGRRPPAAAVGAGIVAGLVTLVYFAVTGKGNVDGINIGIIALVVNAAVLAVVWAVAGAARPKSRPFSAPASGS